MKFKIQKEELNKACLILQRCINQKTNYEPLLNVMVEVKNDHIILYAHDTKIGAKIILDAEVEKEGSFLIESALFFDFIKKSPDQEIEFEEEGNKINITIDQIFIKLAKQDISLYSFIETENTLQKISIPSIILKEMIKMTVYAASKDENNSHLVSSFLEVKDDEISIVSLDLFRLAKKTTRIKSNFNADFLIPSKTSMEIERILSSFDEEIDVDIEFCESSLIFRIENITITSKLLDGEFIKSYANLLTAEYNTKIEVDKNKLSEAISRSSVLIRGNTTKKVIFNIKDNFLNIIIKSQFGDYKEKISIKHEGENLELAFNPDFIYDYLRITNSETIEFYFDGCNKPSISKIPYDDSFIKMILPVKI